MAYNYYPNNYNPYINAYQPYQQQNLQQMQPQTQTVQQPQIQNGGFISVRSAQEAFNYPVALGNSVTFKMKQLRTFTLRQEASHNWKNLFLNSFNWSKLKINKSQRKQYQ